METESEVAIGYIYLYELRCKSKQIVLNAEPAEVAPKGTLFLMIKVLVKKIFVKKYLAFRRYGRN